MANKINGQQLLEFVHIYGKKTRIELVDLIKENKNEIDCNKKEKYCILFNKLIYSIILNDDQINEGLYGRNIKITRSKKTNINNLIDSMLKESIFDNDDYINIDNKYIEHFNKIKCIDYHHYMNQLKNSNVSNFYDTYGYGYVNLDKSNIKNIKSFKDKIKQELKASKQLQSFEILFNTKIDGVS